MFFLAGFVFASLASSSWAAAPPKPLSDWKTVSLKEEWHKSISNPGGAIVYKDKSKQSGKVKTLPDETDVVVTEFHGRRIADPNDRMAVEGWARLSKPVVGWVDYGELSWEAALFDFGFFYGGKPLDDFISAAIDKMHAFVRSKNLKITTCDTNGRVASKSEIEELGEEVVTYYQGNDTFYVDLSGLSEVDYEYFLIYATKDRNVTFPGGFRAGDPVSAIPKSGMVPGKYKTAVLSGIKHHIWVGDWEFSAAEDKNGNIASVMLMDAEALTRVRLNNNFVGFLSSAPARSTRSAQPAPQAKK
jgi:hypothetical protein